LFCGSTKSVSFESKPDDSSVDDYIIIIDSNLIDTKCIQVVVKEDYKLAAGCLGLGLIVLSTELRDHIGVLGGFLALFGAFLTYQVRYYPQFDQTI
jgi:hypothetical protein